MHFTTTTGLVLGLAASSALAHMEMSFPAPFRSKFNPNAGSNIDYSMTAPLKADGSDYPCKGYQSDFGTSAGKSTATFAAGTTNNITIVGGAPHEGGSCQVSLSSDSGKTFTVIQSIIGNCPVQTSGNFDFEIPSDAPTGDVLLAWSWHNAVGNREMYMNCAAVTITGGSSKVKRDTAEKVDDKKEKRATAYSARPQIFVANVGNGCTTVEGGAVEYPSPGDDVTRNSQNALAPSGSCGTSTGGSGSGSGVASSAAASTPVADPTTAAAGETPTSASLPGGVFFTATTGGSGSGSGSETTTPLATPEPTTLATVTTAAGGSGSGAATTTSTAAPASGTGTSGSDAGLFTPGTACTSEGQWNCIGGTSFQRCASGTWSVQMALAAGTSCTAGVSDSLDMFATSNKARRFHGSRGRRYEGARRQMV